MVHIYKKKNKENKMLHGTLYTKKKRRNSMLFSCVFIQVHKTKLHYFMFTYLSHDK